MPIKPINLSIKPPLKKKRRKSFFLGFLGFAFTAGMFFFLAAAGGAGYYLWQISKDLPDYEKLANYKPPVITRVHASDGRLIAEFAKERRIYVPVQSMPKMLINAFLAAEDQNFYKHNGLDLRGIARAVFNNLTKKKKEGASTITQQVAKNFLLTNEQSFTRKAKEAILAIRIERAYTKERILDLYLNQIYLGANSYGVAAAGLRYFGKELHELQLHEVAYLAALPKEPSKFQLTTARNTPKFEEARKRRNDIVDAMVKLGSATAGEGEHAKAMPLEMTNRQIGPSTFAAEYFAEEVRRSLIDMYGAEESNPDSVLAGGYSVRSTLDPSLQLMARTALRAGLVSFDRKHGGWRGPVTRIDVSNAADWGTKLADVPALADVEPWRLGVVLQAAKDKAIIGLQPAKYPNGDVDAERKTVELPAEGMKWAFDGRNAKTKGLIGVSDLLIPGEVIYISPPTELDALNRDNREGKPAKGEPKPLPWQLMQVPQIGGATVVMDPHTGRILSLVGGFSYAESQFDRAVQARRQPGSSFKPVVYAAALDNGYTPASIIDDNELVIDQGPGLDPWKPVNDDKQVHGPSTLRSGVEHSRNLMTVRLAQDMGMPIVSEYARRFGVYEDLPPLLSMSLGAGETTLLRLTTAYCMFVNGGKKITSTFIDRIQDRYGQTIWRHDGRKCDDCAAETWNNQEEPKLADDRPQIVDPMTAYQITSILEGVVLRGTGHEIAAVGKPLAGKTGTTNDAKDLWFIGFSPDIAMGVFVGYDVPQALGHGEFGGIIAAPIFRDFFKLALKDKPATPFRIPDGIKQVRINRQTGQRAAPGDPSAIMENFKPGTEPSDGYNGGVYQTSEAPPTQQQPGGYSGGNANGGWGASTASRPPYDNGGGGGGYPTPFGRQPSAGGLY